LLLDVRVARVADVDETGARPGCWLVAAAVAAAEKIGSAAMGGDKERKSGFSLWRKTTKVLTRLLEVLVLVPGCGLEIAGRVEERSDKRQVQGDEGFNLGICSIRCWVQVGRWNVRSGRKITNCMFFC